MTRVTRSQEPPPSNSSPLRSKSPFSRAPTPTFEWGEDEPVSLVNNDSEDSRRWILRQEQLRGSKSPYSRVPTPTGDWPDEVDLPRRDHVIGSGAPAPVSRKVEPHNPKELKKGSGPKKGTIKPTQKRSEPEQVDRDKDPKKPSSALHCPDKASGKCPKTHPTMRAEKSAAGKNVQEVLPRRSSRARKGIERYQGP